MANDDVTRLPWTRADTVLVVGLTVVGAIVRLIRLAQPGYLTGDERFYVEDGCAYTHLASEFCGNLRETNFEHPPLGKWLIGWSMQLFGGGTLGFRAIGVVLGTLTIALVYLLGRKLLRSRTAAAVGAGLLAIDFMHVVLSRTAMLDVPMVFFGVAALLFLAYDRDRPQGSYPWWRYAAGAAAGAAIACKWTGVTILVTVAFLAIAWDVLARRGPDERHPVMKAAGERGAGWFLAFLAVPAFVYALTFIGRVEGSVLTAPWEQGSWLSAFWDRQLETFRFHAQHIWSHRYASEPWSWPLAKRAFATAVETEGGVTRLVTAAGNPIVWTLSLATIPYVAYRWLKQRTQRSTEGFIVAGAILTYLPWFLYFYAPWLFFTWGRVATFIFYFLPTLPFLYLGAGYCADRIARLRSGRRLVAGIAVFAAASFAFYLPVMTYEPLSKDALEARLFAFDQCDPPDIDPYVYVEPTFRAGTTVFRTRSVDPLNFVPPEGWCWL